MDIVTIQNLKKYFGEGAGQVKALDGITLSIEKGKFTAIIGASGSGKTTLLNSIGGLHRPTEGEITVDGINLAKLSEEQLTVFRRRKVGFVFQDYNLVPELTVILRVQIDTNISWVLSFLHLRQTPENQHFGKW